MKPAQGLLRLRPIVWALLLALLLHSGLLLIRYNSPEQTDESLQHLYAEATEVLLDDQPLEAEQPQPEQSSAEESVAVSENLPEETANQPAPTDEPDSEQDSPPSETLRPRGMSLVARSLEIARLESELAAQQAASAERPRVRRISSSAEMTTEEALYLRQWEEQVERIGNLNYPEEARRQNLGGRLRLLVVINADGSIREAQLMTSSGHRLLDDAAIRILNLASPFAPLPDSIRAKADVLEIIRTWQFGDGWRAN